MAVWVSTDFKLGKTIDNCTVERTATDGLGLNRKRVTSLSSGESFFHSYFPENFTDFRWEKKSAKVRMFSKQQSFGVYRTGPGQGLQFREGAIICLV